MPESQGGAMAHEPLPGAPTHMGAENKNAGLFGSIS
jgi:hypothetical protein